MIDDELRKAATRVLDLCRARGLKIVTAESCTGGLVAAALTEIAGSSDVVDCGFVTYSNEAKQVFGRRAGGDVEKTRRSQRADRRGHGGRCAQKFAGGFISGNYRHRWSRRRLKEKAGRPRLLRRSEPRRQPPRAEPSLRQDRTPPRAVALRRRSARAFRTACGGDTRLGQEWCVPKPALVNPGERTIASSLPALSLSALGVVFGDIGTSPLYTLKTVLGLTGAASRSDGYARSSCRW